jgi:bacterioferritin (cytochrome b1)
MARSDYLLRVASRIANVPAREGQFAAPDGQVIAHLQKFLSAKYAIDMAYRSFADRVHGPWRDALVDHWHEHAKEERDAAYDIAMKIVGLGADPVQSAVQVPSCESTVVGFCKSLMELELRAIENGRRLIALAGDNTAMKVLGENLILVDTQHLDDLRRMIVGSTGG